MSDDALAQLIHKFKSLTAIHRQDSDLGWIVPLLQKIDRQPHCHPDLMYVDVRVVLFEHIRLIVCQKPQLIDKFEGVSGNSAIVFILCS